MLERVSLGKLLLEGLQRGLEGEKASPPRHVQSFQEKWETEVNSHGESDPKKQVLRQGKLENGALTTNGKTTPGARPASTRRMCC